MKFEFTQDYETGGMVFQKGEVFVGEHREGWKYALIVLGNNRYSIPMTYLNHLPAFPSVEPGYQVLAHVLEGALMQAQVGKGRVRHANNKPFDQQPICVITEMVGDGFPVGQAIKKLRESNQMVSSDLVIEAINERRGAINYIAASIIMLEKSLEEFS